MLSAALLWCVAGPVAPAQISLLFMGNSHTSVNDVPGMVRRLLEADGTGKRVVSETIFGGLLNDIWQQPAAGNTLSRRRWSAVVLQAVKMSSSHKYRYSNEGAIQLARASLKAADKVLLFPEWPRTGWDESGYILGQYGAVAESAKGVRVAPVPQAFDLARSKQPRLTLLSADGNHAILPGSYLAACVLALELGAADLRWIPPGVPAETARFLQTMAQRATAP